MDPLPILFLDSEMVFEGGRKKESEQKRERKLDAAIHRRIGV